MTSSTAMRKADTRVSSCRASPASLSSPGWRLGRSSRSRRVPTLSFEIPANVRGIHAPDDRARPWRRPQGQSSGCRGPRRARCKDRGDSRDATGNPGPHGVDDDRYRRCVRAQSLDPSRTGLRLEASTAGARTEKPLDVSPSLRTPIVLTIRPDNLVPLAGRVVDTTGRPARGVELELWAQEAEYAVPARGAMGDDGGVLRTGADGTYRTPRAFRVDHRYRVKAGGQGVSRDWSDWTRFRPGDQGILPGPGRGPDEAAGRTCQRQSGQATPRSQGTVPVRRRVETGDDLG